MRSIYFIPVLIFLYPFILRSQITKEVITIDSTDQSTAYDSTLDQSITNNCMIKSFTDFSYFMVKFKSDTGYNKLILDSAVLEKFWDTVPQPRFWRKLMNLTDDSAYINVYETRRILDTIAAKRYRSLKEPEKISYRDSLKKAFNLPDSTRILFSTGKHFFYKFDNALPNITGSIPVFIENGVDPWYAQAILLIESPNKLQKSNVGAYGPFQLMKYVARKQGLTVNKKMDERKDLKRSAYAASMFMKKVCIPALRCTLDSLHLSYNESDLWFRLLVMHVYHAGAGNVNRLLFNINPSEGGLQLIYKVWQTQAGSFRNASQNYSQVLLAALMEFYSLVEKQSADIRKVEG